MSRPRLSLMIALGALMAASTGCRGKQSYVLVTLQSGAPLSLTGFDVTVGNAGAATMVHVDRKASLPPDESFSFQFGSDRSGDVTFEVRALDASVEKARASGRVALVPHEVATLTISLAAAVKDMDMDAGMADLVRSDAVMPDLTTPDFSGPPPPLRLGAEQRYPAGNTASSAALADFNMDGILDVAVSNSNDNGGGGLGAVAILVGNGDGSFQPPVLFQTGKVTVSVAAADLDGDGRPDIAAVNRDSMSASVLIGKGDGTFQAAKSFPAGTNPTAVAIGLLDADKLPDLAVVNANGCEVKVLLGAGGGTFQAPVGVRWAGGETCASISLGDVDGDGKTDLVAGAADPNAGKRGGAVVWLGAGNGSFGAPRLVGAGGAGWTVALADLNADGVLDIASANGDGTAGVVLGIGDGTFKSPLTFPANARIVDVSLGDLNGDRRVDIVAADSMSQISVLLGNGDGSFLAGQLFQTDKIPYTVAIGDLNRDGRFDVVTPNHVGNNISVFLGR